jgi:hypothetical protein
MDNETSLYKCPNDKEPKIVSDLGSFYFYAAGSRQNPKRPLDGSEKWSFKWTNLEGPFVCDAQGPYSGMTWRQAIRAAGYAFNPSEGAYVYSVDDGGDNCEDDLYFVIDPACPAGPRGYLFYVAYLTWRCAIMDKDGIPTIGYDKNGLKKAMDWPSGQGRSVEGDWWEFGGLPCSYAMNRCAPRFLNDTDKILALEYCKLVADLAGTTAVDRLPTDLMQNSRMWPGWGGARARHYRWIGVLYADGRVDTRDPAAINPLVTDNNAKYWVPALDANKLQ